jgi:5'-3' exonuclease
MKIHLIDGTYELFRAYYAMPSIQAPDGRQVGAVRGLLQSMLALLRQEEATHLGCAFDHVVESFRNDMFAGYKTGAGIPADLLAQFEVAERAMSSLGIVVWPMVEYEADDAIATAAFRWQGNPQVEQIVICSPDKDLTQMVRGQQVVCLDRRRNITYDEAGVWDKFGIAPVSIPDYLGLVGDSADGIPGIPRWGSKTTASVLSLYKHIEAIPYSPSEWQMRLRGADALASSLAEHREEALLYRELATLRLDVELPETLDQLKWNGVRRNEFEELCAELGFSRLTVRPQEWRVES